MAGSEIDYAAVLADLEAKRSAIDSAIAGVRQMLNLGAEQGVTVSSEKKEAAVRFDSFFRMSMPDAIAKYLEMAKTPQSVSEVMEALLTGGFKTTSKNPMPIVGSNLSRMKSAGLLVNVDGKWGLASWYPAARKNDAHEKPRRGRKPSLPSKSTLIQPPPKARRESKSFSKQDVERMRTLQAEGRPLKDIGKEFGVHHLSVWRALNPKP